MYRGTGLSGPLFPFDPNLVPPAGQCGDNPCTWWDNVWARDPCLAYLGCADPNNPLYVGATAGLPAAVGVSVGQEISNSAMGVAQGLVTPGITPTIGSSIALIGILALAGLLVVRALK